MTSTRAPAVLAGLCILLSTYAAAPPPASAGPPAASPAPPGSGRSGEAVPAAVPVWIVPAAGTALFHWVRAQAVSEGVNYALDRSGVRDRLWRAADNLLGLQRDPATPAEFKAEFRRLEGDFRRYAAILGQNGKSDRQVRAELRRLRSDFDDHLRQTNLRLARIDTRLARLERDQRRQMRLLVDLQARVAAVEVRVDEHETRLGRVEEQTDRNGRRIGEVEEIVLPDPHRYLRHEAYLSGGLLYANSPDLGSDAAIGGELSAQYNFNQFFGVFGGFSYMPLTATDTEGMPAGSSVSWDNTNLHLGTVANLLPPVSPASFQVGVGAGITSSRLLYHAPGADRSRSQNATELGSLSNLYVLLKAEAGIAPPAYGFEPVATVGYMSFLDDVAYQDDTISSDAGRSMWFVTLGVRVRQYLRGGSRQGNPGAARTTR